LLSLKSNLQAAGGKALAECLKGNQVITKLDISSNNLGQKDIYNADNSGIIALADAIPDMGAMTKLNISSNAIRAEGGKALAAGLKGNQVITELNISSNDLGYNSTYGDDTSGVIAIADAIPDMGAMMSLTFGEKQVVTMTAEMTEANLGGKLEYYEAQIVAAFLPKCT
jgi:hypothetical protein